MPVICNSQHLYWHHRKRSSPHIADYSSRLFPSRSSEPFQHGSGDGQGTLYYTGANCARGRPHGPYAGSARSRLAAKDLEKEIISRPFSSLKKTPYRSKVQNAYMQEDTPTGGYWNSRGVEHLHIAEQPYSPKQCLWFAWPAIRAPWNIEDGELLYAHIRITIRPIYER